MILPINFQGSKIKAISLLEIIIALLLLAIILTFAIPKFSNINSQNSFNKLKSQYVLILNGLNEYKNKKILLNESLENITLDEASINIVGEKLFSNLINFNIISTNSSEKKSSSWYKSDLNKYVFILSNDSEIEFVFEDLSFKCTGNLEICNRLY